MPNTGTNTNNRVPERPTLEGIDEKFMETWEKTGIYSFNKNSDGEVFSIDTPPPTVSGSLHAGSAFGFAHQDAIARFQRMRGKKVFFPMGWDDNGLPTERRVENYFGIRCDPTIPYDPNFQIPEKPDAKKKVSCSRPNFIELCEKLTTEDEKEFEDVWRRLGLSVDWKFTYTTIGTEARKVSQTAFLRNLNRGEAYLADAPTAWDVTFQTAVAQAEFDDREVDSAYHTIVFTLNENGVETKHNVDTTRPELLPACVALIVNPSDERYKNLIGKTLTTPLFNQEVKVFAHKLADIEKGTGLVMCCTFGDSNDVIWWRELQLPVMKIMGRNGRIITESPFENDKASEIYSELAGKTVFSAKARIVELLQESGELVGEIRPIKHLVKFYDKGDKPLEIVPSNQWYLRNGGRDEPLRQKMIERGVELKWHPEFMHVRYNDWADGLNGDWLVSRQRYFGVSFPIWYNVLEDGTSDRTNPILPDEKDLPIDPSVDVPKGFTEDQRNQPGGFVGDLDIMDTWATSSLSPQIAGRWLEEPDLFEKVFPMNLRPQGPEIIRTWLYDTVLRSEFEHNVLPWKETYINGWVLDPDRKKMSKSVGNVVTPKEYLIKFGADAFRYWACSAAPGTDTAFSVEQIKTGRKLAVKLLNASKLILGFGEPDSVDISNVTELIDKIQLAVIKQKIERATVEFEKMNYSRALENTESVFWNFCDDYLELMKQRAYGAHGEKAALSAQTTGRIALSLIQRSLAPHLPFVTDEVWSWWQEGSIHSANWPTSEELSSIDDLEDASKSMRFASEIIGAIRGAKSKEKVSMRHEVTSITIRNTDDQIELIKIIEQDLIDAGNISKIEYEIGEDQNIEVVLAKA